jgi:hypothetical protein
VLVFFDDILVYSQSFEQHVYHLQQVLQTLQQQQWKVKLSKCSFAQRSLSYLGYVISSEGVSTCSKKITSVANWTSPSNVKEIRSFLGLAGYYRKFVKHFAIIARPLTNLLKKNTVFIWAADLELTFRTL